MSLTDKDYSTYEVVRHIVKYDSYKNNDGSFTDIELIVEERIPVDGGESTFHLDDYRTQTFMELNDKDVILSEDVDRMQLDMFISTAEQDIISSPDWGYGVNISRSLVSDEQSSQGVPS